MGAVVTAPILKMNNVKCRIIDVIRNELLKIYILETLKGVSSLILHFSLFILHCATAPLY